MFCKDIDKLIFNAYKFKCYITLLCMISKKVMSNLYMLGSRGLHGILEMLIALVLSRLIGTCSKDKPKSLSVYFIQRICAQHKSTTIYLASTIDKATEFCFLLTIPRNK